MSSACYPQECNVCEKVLSNSIFFNSIRAKKKLSTLFTSSSSQTHNKFSLHLRRWTDDVKFMDKKFNALNSLSIKCDEQIEYLILNKVQSSAMTNWLHLFDEDWSSSYPEGWWCSFPPISCNAATHSSAAFVFIFPPASSPRSQQCAALYSSLSLLEHVEIVVVREIQRKLTIHFARRK